MGEERNAVHVPQNLNHPFMFEKKGIIVMNSQHTSLFCESVGSQAQLGIKSDFGY